MLMIHGQGVQVCCFDKNNLISIFFIVLITIDICLFDVVRLKDIIVFREIGALVKEL